MMKKFALAVLLFALPALAQTTPPAPAPATPIQNFYAAGVSYNGTASPQVAGTALYAHSLNDGTGTYAFTAVDLLPETANPFTVNTNIGIGVAQKAYTIGKVPIYIPAAAGISVNGTNTGWQYNFGALALIHLKWSKCSSCYILPTVRANKSSVSNGSGLQPIIGALFGWGQ